MMKLFAKMVNTRLVLSLETRGHLFSVQRGFRRLRSIAVALIQMEATICWVFVKKQHIVNVFLDIRKAYDTTWKCAPSMFYIQLV